MLCLLTANAGVMVAEFVGIATAAELFGVSRYLAVPLIARPGVVADREGQLPPGGAPLPGPHPGLPRLPPLRYPGPPGLGLVLRSAVTPTVRPDPEYLLLLVALVGTTITPYADVPAGRRGGEGVRADELPYTRADVITGCVFASLVSIFIIIATAATLYVDAVEAGLPGAVIETAADARPGPGARRRELRHAAVRDRDLRGLDAAPGVLPLATAGSICEAFGWERGVDQEPGEAPVFYGLLTFLIVAGALVALIPGVPVIDLLIVVQVINALILPVMLVFITRMAGDRELMGRYANGRLFKVGAWLVTAIVATLALTLVVATLVLPLLPLGGEP